MTKTKRRLAALGTSAALALGLLTVTTPAQANQGYRWEFTYNSWAACSQAMDYYGQRYTIFQGCTVTAKANGKPIRWRLLVA